jgi:hypothetical protein
MTGMTLPEFIIFSIVSPSNYEKKRELADRKDSITDDPRTNVNGSNLKKLNTDGPSKPSALKSSFILFSFLP